MATVLFISLETSDESVVRGFIPDRLRSSRKTRQWDLPDRMRWMVLGLLRNPSGINPLATMAGIPTCEGQLARFAGGLARIAAMRRLFAFSAGNRLDSSAPRRRFSEETSHEHDHCRHQNP
jgi:hypothetical protein